MLDTDGAISGFGRAVAMGYGGVAMVVIVAIPALKNGH